MYSKKSLGQNFLIDQNVIKKIIDLSEIKGKNIIEIGSGKGALTSEIIKRKPKSLIVIEKDSILAERLKERFCESKILKVFNQDVLKIKLEKIIKDKTIIFGNLPYNISSQIFVKIIRLKISLSKLETLILMFQKEMGDKITCKFPSKNYGRLSILCGLKLNVFKKFLISPNCFSPKPKITSMVICFKIKKNKISRINKIENLEKVTNILFSNRRKMINKSIKKLFNYDVTKKIPNLRLNLRPSEIRPEMFYKITELYEIE